MCERIRVNITGKGKTCAKAQMEVGYVCDVLFKGGNYLHWLE